MLTLLKRTVPFRWFFWAPTTYDFARLRKNSIKLLQLNKLTGKNISTNRTEWTWTGPPFHAFIWFLKTPKLLVSRRCRGREFQIFGCCGAKRPKTVSNCSHLWNFNCSLVPKIIRMIFLKLTNLSRRQIVQNFKRLQSYCLHTYDLQWWELRFYQQWLIAITSLRYSRRKWTLYFSFFNAQFMCTITVLSADNLWKQFRPDKMFLRECVHVQSRIGIRCSRGKFYILFQRLSATSVVRWQPFQTARSQAMPGKTFLRECAFMKSHMSQIHCMRGKCFIF